MKKAVAGIAVLAITLIAAGTYAGFNIPGASSDVNKVVNKATDVGGKEALKKSAENTIKKYNCRFASTETTTEIVCDNGKTWDALLVDLKGLHTVGESIVGKDINIHADAAGTAKTKYKRADKLRGDFKKQVGYFDYYVSAVDGGENIRMWVTAD